MPKGLVIVFTGEGKGKTSAALGVALRACGHRMYVSVVHFIKNPSVSGEERAAERLRPELEIVAMGKGFVNLPADSLPFEEHRRAAEAAFTAARQRMLSGSWDVLILDEINNAVSLGLLPLSSVLDLLKNKPSKIHLILTGRDAHPDIVDAADLVTEMRDVKHPYNKGIPAQKGIDF
ncbi:MAG: cob(I)yrinic acid a,c-diamide adenosyltransferase [Nitrospiraceae bacterium]|nr:cob(I)yrinic acid a,c-diamide adenosyltransferase [Nitrospiraceae bacterium]